MGKRWQDRRVAHALIERGQRPDAPGAVAERARYRAASEQAVKERAARFPVLTPENAAEAIAWQEKRIRELVGK